MMDKKWENAKADGYVFWQYKPGVVMDDREVFEKYRLGKGKLKVKDRCTGWQLNDSLSNDKHWRFDCLEQTEAWMDTHFRILEYGREADAQREHQILRFCCHNMSDEQIGLILECMESFPCSLHIREEK